jgi:hypothetical protein
MRRRNPPALRITFENLGTFEGETEWDVAVNGESLFRVSKFKPRHKYPTMRRSFASPDRDAPWQWDSDVPGLKLRPGLTFKEVSALIVAFIGG